MITKEQQQEFRSLLRLDKRDIIRQMNIDEKTYAMLLSEAHGFVDKTDADIAKRVVECNRLEESVIQLAQNYSNCTSDLIKTDILKRYETALDKFLKFKVLPTLQ